MVYNIPFQRRWFSGKIHRCQAFSLSREKPFRWAPGSIPGRRNDFFFAGLIFSMFLEVIFNPLCVLLSKIHYCRQHSLQFLWLSWKFGVPHVFASVKAVKKAVKKQGWRRWTWNACRVRGGKQSYPAPYSRQQNQWQGPRTLSRRGWLLPPCRPEVLSRSRLQISTKAIFSLIMKGTSSL